MERERKTGTTGMNLRRRRLRAEPLCRHCVAKGRVSASTVPDHIIPLGQGGTDDDFNIQCLCQDCHLIKTATEGQGGAANHPTWLKPSAIPLTIVCGPPCGGKSTYVKCHAGFADTIIELDTILNELSPGYKHWSSDVLDKDLFNKGIRVRNAMLGQLHSASKGSAWFIVSAPTSAERAWWGECLGGKVVVLNPGIVECTRRALARGTPHAVSGVLAWERAANSPWVLPKDNTKQRVAIDIHGWPVVNAIGIDRR